MPPWTGRFHVGEPVWAPMKTGPEQTVTYHAGTIVGAHYTRGVNDRFKIPNKDNSISSKTTIEFPQKRQRKFPKNDRVNSSQTTI